MNAYELKFVIDKCRDVLTKVINAKSIVDAVTKVSKPYEMHGYHLEIISIKRVA